MLRLHTDTPTIRYVVSLLGKRAQQKAALYFHSDSEGSADLYLLRPRRGSGGMRGFARQLDEAGIEFSDDGPNATGGLIYVIDLKRELRAKIISAAKRLKARVVARRGSAEFIGDDSSREKAAAIFDGEVTDYESKHSALVEYCGNQSSRVR